MANISWYGGASVRGQTWPINDQNATMQPFVVSDLKDNPSGFGSALERYFLGSSGKWSLMGFAPISSLEMELEIFSTAMLLQEERSPQYGCWQFATLAIGAALEQEQGLLKLDPT